MTIQEGDCEETDNTKIFHKWQPQVWNPNKEKRTSRPVCGRRQKSERRDGVCCRIRTNIWRKEIEISRWRYYWFYILVDVKQVTPVWPERVGPTPAILRDILRMGLGENISRSIGESVSFWFSLMTYLKDMFRWKRFSAGSSADAPSQRAYVYLLQTYKGDTAETLQEAWKEIVARTQWTVRKG